MFKIDGKWYVTELSSGDMDPCEGCAFDKASCDKSPLLYALPSCIGAEGEHLVFLEVKNDKIE